jgi:hypothetical protein
MCVCMHSCFIENHPIWILEDGPLIFDVVLSLLRYNLLSVSQLVDAASSVLFRKSDSRVLDSSGGLVCGVSRIGNVFQADFSLAQSSLKCLLSQSSSKL